jgi:hypothetical protein
VSGCEHPPPPAKTPEQEEVLMLGTRRLYRYLADTEGLSVEFVAGVLMGYMAREHVDECHPGEVELALSKWLETMAEGERRDGWVAGYRFNESRGSDAIEPRKDGDAPDA